MTVELYKLLLHAYNTTPYYKRVFDECNVVNGGVVNWDNVPILSKKTLKKEHENFISNIYSDEYYKGSLINKITSGSTGMMMDVIWSLNDYSIANREAWKYRKKWYGIDVYDKYICFHSTLYSGNKFVDEEIDVLRKSVYISFSKNKINKNIHTYMDEIMRFKPTWLLIQPSVLMIMLSLLNDAELAFLNELKYIELTGEYLQYGTKDYFNTKLPNVMFSNMYGTTETGCIALQCPYGHCHILGNAYVEIGHVNDNVYSEYNISKNENIVGNIILTSLRNKAMPIIKYDIGDVGYVKSVECECGFNGYDVNILAGRTSELIELPDGGKLPSYTLWYPVEAVNDEYNNPIIQANFIQNETNSLNVYILLKNGYKNWTNSIIKSLKKYLNLQVSNSMDYIFTVTCDNVDALNESNKMMFFKNAITRR